MKFHHGNVEPVERFGEMEETTFSIEASQKAFSILIDGLYADKIRSIVREACANAFDGHIKSQRTDRPFTVHCPTRWEPWFSVRDFGCSMEHDFVMKLYTRLFYSSKDTSDDETGCFGLGSKAPFAYTQTFTVTTYLKGEQRTYTAFLDDKPRMVLNETVKTKEHDGVLVSFPVQEKDFSAFRKAIEIASYGYDLPFTCEGVTLPKLVYSERKGDYDICSNLPETGPLVRIGPVLYRFDKENESAKQVFEQVNPDITILLSQAGDTILNIGVASGQVLPNREALSYTEKMIAQLAKHLDRICKDARKKVDDAFADCKTVWDFALKYRELDKSKDLSRYQQAILHNHVCTFGKTMSLCCVENIKFRDPGMLWEYARVNNYKRRDGKQLYRDERVALVTVDAEDPVNMLPARINLLARTHDYDRVYVIRRYDPRAQFKALERSVVDRDRETRTKMLKGGYDSFYQGKKRIAEVIKSFGCPVHYEGKNLPKPARVVRAPSAPTVYEIKKNAIWSANKLDNFDEDDLTLVLPLDSRTFKPWSSPPLTEDLCAHFRLLGHRFKVALGVSRSKISALRTHCPKWKTWDDALAVHADVLDRLVNIADDHAFLNWYNNHSQPVMRAQRLSAALKFCDAKTIAKFDVFMLAVEAVSGKASLARKRTAAWNKAGVSPTEYNTDIVNKLLTLLNLPPTAPPKDGESVATAETALYAQYPELPVLLADSTTGPATLAAYLIGRPQIKAPVDAVVNPDDEDGDWDEDEQEAA